STPHRCRSPAASRATSATRFGLSGSVAGFFQNPICLKLATARAYCGDMQFSSSVNVGELLQKARDGDGAARDRLFDVCRNYVSIVARAEMASWLKAKVDASDLVQQTLLEAHRGLNDFRGTTEAEWLGWLRRILVHNAADFVRRFHGVEKRCAGREVALAAADDSAQNVPQLSDGGPTPSQLVMQKELQLQVAD